MKTFLLMTLLAFGAVSVSFGESCYETEKNKCIEEENCEDKTGIARAGCTTRCFKRAREACW